MSAAESLAHLKKCLDLTEGDVAAAVESRTGTRALLLHLAKISSAGTGAAKSLLVFARMSTTACEWLDGDLRIEIVGDAEVSAIEVLEEIGMGMRERVFPPLAFAAPLEEFTRAVERVPHMIAPLAVQAKTARRLVLGATAEIRRSSLPPSPVKIAPESFFVPKAPAPVRPIPAAKDDDDLPGLPVIEPASATVRAVKKQRSSRPPPPRESPSSARVAAAKRTVAVIHEVPEVPDLAELPVVLMPAQPAPKKAPPAPRPPPAAPKPKPKPPPPPPPKAAAKAPKKPSDPPVEKTDADDVDSGWEDS